MTRTIAACENRLKAYADLHAKKHRYKYSLPVQSGLSVRIFDIRLNKISMHLR